MFSQLLAIHAENQKPCSFKVMDATHIKVHQDACRHSQPAEQRALGETKGGRNSKLHACVNGNGKALFLPLQPGNEHEVLTALDLLRDVKAKAVLADRGYDSDKLRSRIDASGGSCDPSEEG